MLFFHVSCYKKLDIFLEAYKSALRTRRQQRQRTSIHPENALPDRYTNWIHPEIPFSFIMTNTYYFNRLLAYILVINFFGN